VAGELEAILAVREVYLFDRHREEQLLLPRLALGDSIPQLVEDLVQLESSGLHDFEAILFILEEVEQLVREGLKQHSRLRRRGDQSELARREFFCEQVSLQPKEELGLRCFVIFEDEVGDLISELPLDDAVFYPLLAALLDGMASRLGYFKVFQRLVVLNLSDLILILLENSDVALHDCEANRNRRLPLDLQDVVGREDVELHDFLQVLLAFL